MATSNAARRSAGVRACPGGTGRGVSGGRSARAATAPPWITSSRRLSAPGSAHASEHSLRRRSQRPRRTAWAARTTVSSRASRHALCVPRGPAGRLGLRLFRAVRPGRGHGPSTRPQPCAEAEKGARACRPGRARCTNRASPAAKHSARAPRRARPRRPGRARRAGEVRRGRETARSAESASTGAGETSGPTTCSGSGSSRRRLEVRRREPDRSPVRRQGDVERRRQALDLVRLQQGRLERGLGLGAGHVAGLRQHLQGALARRGRGSGRSRADAGRRPCRRRARRRRPAAAGRRPDGPEARGGARAAAESGAVSGGPAGPARRAARRGRRRPRARRAARPGGATRTRWRPRGRRCAAGAAPPPRSSRPARAASGGAAPGAGGRRWRGCRRGRAGTVPSRGARAAPAGTAPRSGRSGRRQAPAAARPARPRAGGAPRRRRARSRAPTSAVRNPVMPSHGGRHHGPGRRSHDVRGHLGGGQLAGLACRPPRPADLEERPAGRVGSGGLRVEEQDRQPLQRRHAASPGRRTGPVSGRPRSGVVRSRPLCPHLAPVQTKLAASLGSPWPLYVAVCG